MRKEIRLLVEGFFDDDIFKPNDINLDILDIGDLYYDYQVSDIYYKDNKPYAICCGSKDIFNDKSERFLYLYNNEKYDLPWCDGHKSYIKLNEPCFHKYDDFINKFEDKIDNGEIDNLDEDGEKIYDWEPNEKDCKLYFGYNLKTIKDFMHIDENGYSNTQIIKNKYNLKEFPAFKTCCDLGNNIYLPAIDELLILFLNLETNKNNLRNKINEIKKSIKLNYDINQYLYWSSSLLYILFPYYIKLYSGGSALKNSYYYTQVLTETNYLNKSVIPFIKF